MIDDEGNYWTTYAVSVFIPFDFPSSLPWMEETGGRIEQHEDWHNVKSCCVSTPAIMFAELADDFTLSNWFIKFAYPFLMNHVFRLETGGYANGEFDHYTPGTLQGYFKLLKTTNVKEVIERLKLMSGVKPMGKNAKCFCGSGKRIKDCYSANPNSHMLNIPEYQLRYDLEAILTYERGKRKIAAPPQNENV